MNGKQKVSQAIRRVPVEIVPYQIGFTPEAYRKMADYYHEEDFLSALGNCMEFIDPRPPKVVPRENHVQDEFGVIFNKTKDKEIGVVEEYPVDSGNVNQYAFPDKEGSGWFTKFDRFTEGGRYNVAQFSHVFFERAWMLYGMENVLSDMILNPGAVDDLMDRLLDYFLALVDRACQYRFVDCCYFGDDWGQQRGLIMGPKLWRRFIKPRLKILFDRVRAHGRTVYIHTCGDIREILPDIIEVGVDIYDPFQPEVFDIAALKREYGRDITFLGGVSLQRVLPFGTVEEVREEVVRKIDMARSGGYIVGPSHALTKDVPAENIVEMVAILKNQG